MKNLMLPIAYIESRYCPWPLMVVVVATVVALLIGFFA
jgi:hypothetical protein